jgi:hypothetical protein
MGKTGSRIFQIGFNRCGTQALSTFFRLNGIACSHWGGGAVALKFDEDRQAQRQPFTESRRVVAYTDMVYCDHKVCIEPFKDFSYIYQYYPEAYYILNTRHCEDWLRSRQRHRGFVERMISVLGVRGEREVLNYWRVDWYRHHANVFDFFSRRPTARLLVFDIDRDRADALVAFLKPDFPELSADRFGHVDKTRPRVLEHRIAANVG